MANKDTNDFDILIYIVQQLVLLLVTTGLCARIKYGKIGVDVTIQDGKVVHSNPRIELSIRAENN